MTPPVASAVLDQPRAIDVRAIEHELSELWKQAQTGDPDAITRVCVLNLVVGVPNNDVANHVTSVIAQLTTRYPNRAIVVQVTPEAQTAALDAWVQAHCQVPGPDRRQVCCEQITVSAQGEVAAQVSSIVLPLLVPDVPMVLWWPHGEPFQSPVFERLCVLADRVVIDTATFKQPEQSIEAMAALLEHDHAISDLVWGRLTSWRELTAQFFDMPSRLPLLHQIARVSIEYTAKPDAPLNRSSALLLIGWLASRLGWTPVGSARDAHDTTMLTLQRSDGQPVEATLRSVATPDAEAGLLTSMVLEAPHARFSITRKNTSDWASAQSQVDGRSPLQHGVRLEQPSDAELLGEELRLLKHDQNYKAAFRAAVQMLQ
jgi:glucose-6-phosphate dehydrogenase assembly protein OpcA